MKGDASANEFCGMEMCVVRRREREEEREQKEGPPGSRGGGTEERGRGELTRGAICPTRQPRTLEPVPPFRENPKNRGNGFPLVREKEGAKGGKGREGSLD